MVPSSRYLIIVKNNLYHGNIYPLEYIKIDLFILRGEVGNHIAVLQMYKLSLFNL